jgi:hypothetical protein
MQRLTEEARGPRCWTRFLGGSALALALALPGAALAEPAPGDSGAAEVRTPVQSGAGATQMSPTMAYPGAQGESQGGQTNRRGNCENDFTQSCFQPGAGRAPSEEPQSYAQSYFQPGAAPER